MGTFSFYGNKIITTGEGGMVVTNDEHLADKVRFLKDHAMDPSRRYYHTDVGYNMRMTNIQAALGCAQMERIKDFLLKRSQILEWYQKELESIKSIIAINPVMAWAEPVNWMTCILFDEKLQLNTESVISSLKQKNIDTRPFFVPINKLSPYKDCKSYGSAKNMIVAETLSANGLNLPTATSLTKENILFIKNELKVLTS